MKGYPDTDSDLMIYYYALGFFLTIYLYNGASSGTWYFNMRTCLINILSHLGIKLRHKKTASTFLGQISRIGVYYQVPEVYTLKIL